MISVPIHFNWCFRLKNIANGNTALITLANRNDYLCRVTQGGQGKYSHMSLLLALSPTNVANVNEPLRDKIWAMTIDLNLNV
jgi:hypothetical protein